MKTLHTALFIIAVIVAYAYVEEQDRTYIEAQTNARVQRIYDEMAARGMAGEGTDTEVEALWEKAAQLEGHLPREDLTR